MTRAIALSTSEQAQTQAEYALLLTGLFLAAAAAVLLLGTPIGNIYQAVIDALA